MVEQVFPKLAVTLQDSSIKELYRGVSKEIVRRNLAELGSDPKVVQAMEAKEVAFEVFEE